MESKKYNFENISYSAKKRNRNSNTRIRIDNHQIFDENTILMTYQPTVVNAEV